MKPFSRKRLSMSFGVFGVVLMGVDLMMTRSVFVHIGELMAASIACFVIALVLDRRAANPSGDGPPFGRRSVRPGKSGD